MGKGHRDFGKALWQPTGYDDAAKKRDEMAPTLSTSLAREVTLK